MPWTMRACLRSIALSSNSSSSLLVYLSQSESVSEPPKPLPTPLTLVCRALCCEVKDPAEEDLALASCAEGRPAPARVMPLAFEHQCSLRDEGAAHGAGLSSS